MIFCNRRLPITKFVFMLFRTFERCFFYFCWPVFFLLFCFFLYEQALNKFQKEYRSLHAHLVNLNQQKEIALHNHESLVEQINSQSDLAWVELTLMRGLGVVPENQHKFFFLTP